MDLALWVFHEDEGGLLHLKQNNTENRMLVVHTTETEKIVEKICIYNRLSA